MAHDKDEWGNIELPGLCDEKLFNTNWNLVQANRDTIKNPEMVAKRNEAAKRAGVTKRNSAEYKRLMTEVNRKKAQAPDFSKKISEGRKKWLETAEGKEIVRAVGEKKRNDPAYRELMTEVNRKKAQAPDFRKKDSEAIKKKWQDPEYQQKQAAKAISQQKAITDPNGKYWASAKAAAPVWFPDKTLESAVKTIRKMIADNRGWKYV